MRRRSPGPGHRVVGPRLLCCCVLAAMPQGCARTLGPGLLGALVSVSGPHLDFWLSSPIGEVFRARLRQFPSLVNCCTIDWFNEWPAEALKSVATMFLNEIPELESSQEEIQGLVGVLVKLRPLGRTV